MYTGSYGAPSYGNEQYGGYRGGHPGQPVGYNQPGGYGNNPNQTFGGQPPYGGVNPEVQSWFNAVDKDRSGKINSKELQAALINGQGKNFSDTACHLMIGMFDHDKSGTIDANEFQQLYTYINQWLSVFRMYDRDQSGSIEEPELGQALQQMGFRFSPEFIRLLMNKSDPQAGKLMSVDQFITISVQIQRFTEAFRVRDSEMKGVISVTFDDFMDIAFNSCL